jgi:hypothetical protein
MPAAGPRLGGLVAHQPEIRLVHQSGSLESLPRLLGGKTSGGELAQLVVDEREQAVGGHGVARRGGGDQVGHIGHVQNANSPFGGRHAQVVIGNSTYRVADAQHEPEPQVRRGMVQTSSCTLGQQEKPAWSSTLEVLGHAGLLFNESPNA